MIILSLDYLEKHETLLRLKQLMVWRCYDGTRFSFFSHRGTGELAQLLVLTMKPIRQVSMDLEHLVMTYRKVAVSGDVGKGESTSATTVMVYGA